MAPQAQAQTAPPNDNLSDAFYLHASSLTATQSNTAGTKQTGEPDHNDSPADASVWYQWTAPENLRVTLTLENSKFDTLLAVYTGASIASLTPVASDDDSGGDLTSAVTFNALSGSD